MGIQYELINITKQETISFVHLNGSKFNELLMNHPQSAITTLYLLNNQGDIIRFISDHDENNEGWHEKIKNYKDVTQNYIDELLERDIFINQGYLYQDEEKPEELYVLNLALKHHNFKNKEP